MFFNAVSIGVAASWPPQPQKALGVASSELFSSSGLAPASPLTQTHSTLSSLFKKKDQ
jgi:hypothetical protein